MDLRTASFDVPARAHGTRPGVPPMSMRRDARPQGDEPNGRRTMDTGRNDLLGELARDAELERSDYIVQATEQLRRFLDANRGRISDLGGLTLIDEDPDYLSI